jgi:hypothetical protein
VFDNESKLTLSAMYISASKVFQRLHNEGLITQCINKDSYYEKLYVIQNVEDEIVNQDAIDEIILRRSEARS